MKIIRFDPTTTTEGSDETSRMFLEEASFSCPHCEKRSSAKFSGIIFRVMEFYCKHCGSFFKVTNPAFSQTKPKKK